MGHGVMSPSRTSVVETGLKPWRFRRVNSAAQQVSVAKLSHEQALDACYLSAQVSADFKTLQGP
jgi:hypothetical protein